MIDFTPLAVARRLVGCREVPGAVNNPAIVAMLQLDSSWAHDDEVPWCAAFANWCAWLAGFDRSTSLRARDWLSVGRPVDVPARGDVVVLSRGMRPQPGPEVADAPGHVGFVSDAERHLMISGNLGDRVQISHYDPEHVLGYRRIGPRHEGTT